MEIFIIGVICLVIYFLPSIIASGKKQCCAISVLNLLLGWTLVGWVVAIVWACCEDSEPVKEVKIIEKEAVKQTNGYSKYDELERLADLKNKGIISEEEFNQKKKSILGIESTKESKLSENNEISTEDSPNNSDDIKYCSNCGKAIKKAAKKCRYCGTWFEMNEQESNQE